MENPLIQVYTGEGKGKTTAALGLAIRAAGRGLKTIIIQFMKNQDTGEKFAIERIKEISIESYGSGKFLKKGKIKSVDKREAQKGLDRAYKALEEGWDIIILDEINMVLDYDLISKKEFMDFIRKYKGFDIELVLTGRNAPKKVLELANLVTNMECLKHPYEEGYEAREGIEF